MKGKGFQLVALLVCSTVVSSACLSSGAALESAESVLRHDEASPDEAAPLAELVGFEESESGVRIRVISTGCTQAEDFEIIVDRLADDRAQLTVLRLSPDDCRRMPAAKTLEFSRESLGLDNEEVILMNPLVALPGRG